MLDRTSPPMAHPIAGFELIRPKRLTFANGLKVFVFNGGNQDLVRVEWIFAPVFDNESDGLLNATTCELLLEGTATYSSAQIAEQVDFCGAYLVPQVGYDQSSLTLFSLHKHLGTLLPLVKDILTNAIFPAKELETYVRNHKQKLQVSLKKNSFVARRLFNKHIFGQTRYGYVFGPSDYDQLTVNALLARFGYQYRPSNCTLMVSGRVTDGIVTELERLFGDAWQLEVDKVATAPPAFVSPHARLVVDERKDALQSAIRLGYQSIQRAHPDFPGLQVLNTLLGGYFGSRLMANIREDKGFTYSINSGLASLKHSAFFTIATEVGTAVTGAALAEIEAEIHRLRNEPVGSDELALVRSYIMGSMLGSLENIFSHADKFKNVYFSGLDVDYYDYYTDVVNRITPDELLQLANTYLDYDKMVKIVVGKYQVNA